MATIALGDKVDITVSFPKGKTYTADLHKELSINLDNLNEEIITQPAKFAWWAVLTELTRKKVEIANDKLLKSNVDDRCYSQVVQEYIQACKEFELVCHTKEALNHRKIALLKLWGDKNLEVLDEYNINLLKIGALLRSLSQDEPN